MWIKTKDGALHDAQQCTITAQVPVYPGRKAKQDEEQEELVCITLEPYGSTKRTIMLTDAISREEALKELSEIETAVASGRLLYQM